MRYKRKIGRAKERYREGKKAYHCRSNKWIRNKKEKEGISGRKEWDG